MAYFGPHCSPPNFKSFWQPCYLHNRSQFPQGSCINDVQFQGEMGALKTKMAPNNRTSFMSNELMKKCLGIELCQDIFFSSPSLNRYLASLVKGLSTKQMLSFDNFSPITVCFCSFINGLPTRSQSRQVLWRTFQS